MATVYIDSSAMSEWKTQMENINKECISSIEEIENYVGNLSSSFQGTYASQYIDSFSSFSTKVKQSHVDMSDFNAFLDTIVNVMNGQ